MLFNPQNSSDHPQDKRHRRSICLPGYDYSQAGGYFVTVVTWQRECLFGEIANGVMRLDEWGEIVREEWERTAEIRREVELGAFVVMPNHFHGILIFVDDVVGTDIVGATRGSPLHGKHYNHGRWGP